MRDRPHKLNISQLSERSGMSASKIDLLIQDGIVSKPVDGYMFTVKHEAELRGIKKLADDGCTINLSKRTNYVLDWFVVP